MKLLTLILKLFTLIVKHIANQKDLSLTSAEKFNWISNEFHFQQVYEEVILMFFFLLTGNPRKNTHVKRKEKEREEEILTPLLTMRLFIIYLYATSRMSFLPF